jgi:3-hydroxyacyl-[acyl-carrier-protein] dehydratase
MIGFDGLTLVEAAVSETSVHLKLRLEAGSALVDGHFPGEPILPGVAHLALAQEAAERLERRPVLVLGLRNFRLRQVVRPGDVIDVRVTRSPTPTELRFEMRVGDAVASSGILTIAREPSDG